MNISITFRHMNATDAVKGYATEKVAKMQRFLRVPLKSQVTLSCQQDRLHSVEVDIHAGHADGDHGREKNAQAIKLLALGGNHVERRGD